MECPICLQNFSRHKIISLECAHQFCFSCAHKWLIQHQSCPLCRNKSSYFSKSTRSYSKALQTLIDFRNTIDLCNLILQNDQHKQFKEIILVAEMIQFYILDQHSIWYRPEMISIISELHEKVLDTIHSDIFRLYHSDIQNIFFTFHHTFKHLL